MGERGEPAGLWSRDDPFGIRGLGTGAGEVVTGSGAVRVWTPVHRLLLGV